MRVQACLKVAKRNVGGSKKTKHKKKAMRIKTERALKVPLLNGRSMRHLIVSGF